MSQTDVQLVIGKLMTDQNFRRSFEEGAEECLAGLCAHGVALNETEIAALVEADPRIWSQMAARIDRRLRTVGLAFTPAERRAATLTAREQRVLRGVFEGLTNKEIAGALGVSESAVKATLQQLFRKGHVRTRSQLVRVAIEGWLGTIRKAG